MKYCELRIFLFRPSPQVTQPSPRAAEICYDAAAYIINLSKEQVEKGAIDITWLFLMNLYMSLNVLLWSVSYQNIRQAHPREDVEELVDVTLDILEQCTDRWPGTQAAANLYSVLSRACLQVYDGPRGPPDLSVFDATTPFPDLNDPTSSQEATPVAAANNQGADFTDPPNFGYVFNQQPGGMMDPSFSFNNTPFSQQDSGPQGPTFRSNSIFFNPSSVDGSGRRFSHFAPDFSGGEGAAVAATAAEDPTTSATMTPVNPSATPPIGVGGSIPTPPESISLSMASPSGPPATTPILAQQQTPSSITSTPHTLPASPQPNRSPYPSQPQQPLPSGWYNPPFAAPFAFPANNSFYPPDASQPFASPTNFGGALTSPFGSQFDDCFQRHGSLSQEQGAELMQTLENDGLGEIDALLNLGHGDFVW